jgi:hypothetical protein
VFFQYGEHGRRWVREGAELAAQQAESEVLSGDEGTRDQVAGRVAEHEQAPGVVARGGEQPLVVG